MTLNVGVDVVSANVTFNFNTFITMTINCDYSCDGYLTDCYCYCYCNYDYVHYCYSICYCECFCEVGVTYCHCFSDSNCVSNFDCGCDCFCEWDSVNLIGDVIYKETHSMYYVGHSPF